MTTIAVVGAQWGDEGKGKVVDVLAADADAVARFSGGNNAGHTLVVDGRKIITHLVPSGCAYPGTLCILGSGMVIDPSELKNEVAAIQDQGMLQGKELKISYDAHVIFPYHREMDGLREDLAKGANIGTTRRGIGPAYEAKAGRRGIRIRDLNKPDVLGKILEQNCQVLESEMRARGQDFRIDCAAMQALAKEWWEWLEPMVCDTGELILEAIESDKRVLFEGAQGALLDLDHGTYPYVTSTSTTAGGVCQGLGIGPRHVNAVWGITKAYTTRVGAGPFPTCLEGEQAEQLRKAGGEFGATTGRPRDCGWLDLPALRYAARRNGFSGLCVTKLDVLAALPEVYVCRRYKDGADPGKDGFVGAQAEFEKISGWGDPTLQAKISAARSLEDLPLLARQYLDMIRDYVGAEIGLISVGPGRDQTILLRSAFE